MTTVHPYLLIRLESPMASFGGPMVDAYGVNARFPSRSAITGLLANALGFVRSDADAHQQLQQRLTFAVCVEAPGSNFTDFQTAELAKSDKGWTTRGIAMGRAGGIDTYASPHLRYRAYHSDLSAMIALRLDPRHQSPTLEDVETALATPARPLFIGRKPCLPTAYLGQGQIEAASAIRALLMGWTPMTEGGTRDTVACAWCPDEGDPSVSALRAYSVTDDRDWANGTHVGSRTMLEGVASVGLFKGERES